MHFNFYTVSDFLLRMVSLYGMVVKLRPQRLKKRIYMMFVVENEISRKQPIVLLS